MTYEIKMTIISKTISSEWLCKWVGWIIKIEMMMSGHPRGNSSSQVQGVYLSEEHVTQAEFRPQPWIDKKFRKQKLISSVWKMMIWYYYQQSWHNYKIVLKRPKMISEIGRVEKFINVNRHHKTLNHLMIATMSNN